MTRCELCKAPPTHCCSGLDIPMLHFCARCIKLHERTCDALKNGDAAIVRLSEATEVLA